MKHQTIFATKDIKRRVQNFLSEKIKNKSEKIEHIKNWQENIKTGKIIKQKEEELQSRFLHTFFGEILEYDYKNSKEWNLIEEAKTNFDATKADGALGFFSIDKNKNILKDIRVVIELKNARTSLDKPQNRKDFKGSPVEQAFMYANKIGKSCKWVIVSNFLEIRLYPANDINKYESFDISSLLIVEEFNRFYYLLSKGQLFLHKRLSVIEHALDNRIEDEKKISEEFYAHYKTLRELFVRHLITHNKTIPVLKIINFAQTIIDRVVFISVIKDYNLLSVNILKDIEDIAEKSWADDGMELWRQLKKLFKVLDIGLPPRLHKFNGGLFKQNQDINDLSIKDYFLTKLLKLSTYDFESDLSINILGHIFEHSISDIEKLKKEVTEKYIDEETDQIDDLVKQKVSEEINQRKKHGIFYTPEYITRYIVENTVGKWLNNEKEKIGINNIQELASGSKEKKEQLEFWEKYKTILNSIKIIDPACGSGAFLTQAFDYLLKEWKIIIDVTQKLNGFIPEAKKNGALNLEANSLPDDLQDWKIKKQILKNNIFGVDLNPESIEITKLGLWLKTASRKDNLANLNDNIKCGNSLIFNEKVAKNKAFDWQNEYKQIFAKGGFDIVIGNPPYGVDFNENEKKELEKFDSLTPDYEIYYYFVTLGMKLLSQNGFLSYIIPNTFLSNHFAKKYRQNILNNYQVGMLTDLSELEIFDDASVRNCIVSLKNSQENEATKFSIYSKSDNQINTDKYLEKAQLENEIGNWLTLFTVSKKMSGIIKKIRNSKFEINDICEVSQGLIPYDKYRGHDEKTIKNRIWHSNKQKDETYKKELKGGDIKKYSVSWNGKLWISYGDWLAAPREKKYFTEARILIREIAKYTLLATYTDIEYYNTPSIINIIQANKDYSLKYVLAILNSKLIGWYHYNTSPKAKKGLFPKILVKDVRNIPIPQASEKEQSKFVKLVDEIMNLHKELNNAKQNFTRLIESDLKIKQISKRLKTWYNLEWADFSEELDRNKAKWTMPKKKEWQTFFINEKETIIPVITKITKINKNIDKIVYKLYGLSKEEIKIIEQKVEY